ncbi:MAG: hypothetical protein ACK46Y_07485, partial [Fluviicola sp.]
LSATGTAWFIIPFLSSNPFLEIIEANNLNLKRQIESEGKPGQKVRVIFELGKQETKTIIETFVIRDEENNYTDEYVDLTKEFHNKSVR